MRFFLLFIAGVIAVFAGIAAMQLTSPEKTETPNIATNSNQNVSTVDVLVAKSPIPAGTVITAAMLDKQPWPEHLVLAGFVVNSGNNANIIGKITRSNFQAREPLIISKLAATTDTGFLAASLPAGSRAVTISTDAITGVAGFVFPGDHVDLVFTHNVPQDIRAAQGSGSNDKTPAGEKPGYSEILASNVTVLAINLRENATKEEISGGPTIIAQPAIVAPSSMTLQVSDIQAEKIRLAEKVGTLSVALRSITDRDNKQVAGPADLLSITQLSAEEPPATQADTVKVVKGGDFGAQGGNR